MRGAHPERALEGEVARAGVFRRGERVLAACSGGPDSVALAGILAAIAPALDLTVCLAHVNHHTRPSADQDEAVATAVATALELPLSVLDLDRSPQASESELREARYAALVTEARRSGAESVAVAHHAEDQTETILLALFRGAGPEGLAGMPTRRRLADEIALVRPLLRFASEDLRAYCHWRALPYVIDPTNLSLDRRRNAVRTSLAALRPLFPGLDEAAARAAALLADERAGRVRARSRRRVRERLLEADALDDVTFERIEAIARTLERRGSGRFRLGEGVTAVVRGERLEVERE